MVIIQDFFWHLLGFNFFEISHRVSTVDITERAKWLFWFPFVSVKLWSERLRKILFECFLYSWWCSDENLFENWFWMMEKRNSKMENAAVDGWFSINTESFVFLNNINQFYVYLWETICGFQKTDFGLQTLKFSLERILWSGTGREF